MVLQEIFERIDLRHWVM